MSQVKFIITKKSRATDQPYSGKSCGRAKIQPGTLYGDFWEAKKDAEKLQKVNPTGWRVKPVVF